MKRMFDVGASAYLTKPLDIQQLLKAVDDAIRLESLNEIQCLKS